MSKKKKNNKRNNWRKNVRLNEILPPIENASITRYTYDAWMKTYPESKREDWEEKTRPDCVADFLVDSLECFGDNVPDLEKLTIVALGDDYFKWLEEKGFSNDGDSRLKYISSVSSEDAQMLWDKNGMNREYGLFGICVAVVNFAMENKTTYFTLSEEKRRALKSRFETVFGKNNVWVSKMFLRPDAFYNNANLLENVGKQYLITGNAGVENCLGLFAHQTYINDRINITNLYIPVVVAKDIKKCVFDVGEFMLNMKSYYPECVEFNECDAVFQNLLPLANIDAIHAMPCLIRWSDIPKTEKALLDAIKKDGKKQKIQIEFYENN